MAPYHLRAAYNALLDAVAAERREKARLEQLRADLIEQCRQERQQAAQQAAQQAQATVKVLTPAPVPAPAQRLVKVARVAIGQPIAVNGYRWIVRQILGAGMFLCDSLDATCPPGFRYGTTVSCAGGFVLTG